MSESKINASGEVTIKFSKCTETGHIIADVTIDGHEFFTSGRDHVEALYMAADCAYLVTNRCTSSENMKHCFCQPVEAPKYADDSKPWLKCCKCPTKTLQDFIDD